MMLVVNFFAHFSVTLYNSHRILRVLSRKGYIWLGKLHRGLQFGRFQTYKQFRAKALPAAELYQRYFWPYSNSRFFPEVDNPVEENVLGDEFRFVPRRSTSLCNFAHYILTGKALRTPGVWHAKDWLELLRLNGYDRFCCSEPFHANGTVQKMISSGYDPRQISLQSDGFYIGVNPNAGEYGEVVWFEGFDFPQPQSGHSGLGTSPSALASQKGTVIVSTCRDRLIQYGRVKMNDYVWVFIDKSY